MPKTPEPGRPIYDRTRLSGQPQFTESAPKRDRPKEAIRVINRAEKDEYLWLKNRIGGLMTVLFYSGSCWEHCRFVKLHTFSLVMANENGTECLLFKHSIAALIPETGADQYEPGMRRRP